MGFINDKTLQNNKTISCENCLHAETCKYKDDVHQLIDDFIIDEELPISIVVKCKYYKIMCEHARAEHFNHNTTSDSNTNNRSSVYKMHSVRDNFDI